MVKLGKIPPLIIIIFLGLFLATIVIANNISQKSLKSPSSSPLIPIQSESPEVPKSPEFSKLQVCPDAWYKNEQPCVYKDSPAECEQQRKEYFIIDGKRKELEGIDVEWVKENCEVNKPQVVS